MQGELQSSTILGNQRSPDLLVIRQQLTGEQEHVIQHQQQANLCKILSRLGREKL